MLRLTGNNKTKKFGDFNLINLAKTKATFDAEFSFLMETSYGIIDAQDDVDNCTFHLSVGTTDNTRVYVEVVPDDMTYYHEINMYFKEGRLFDYEGCTSLHTPIIKFLEKFLTYNGKQVDLSYVS